MHITVLFKGDTPFEFLEHHLSITFGITFPVAQLLVVSKTNPIIVQLSKDMQLHKV